MNISELVPQPSHRERFNRSRERFIPEEPGCYVLATFSDEVMYIGLAENLRRRVNNHLDNPAKVAETKLGRAVWFYWIISPETNKIERTWMNIHNLFDGSLPLLNKLYSPTPT
jgi:hypothetical protein